jgi:hypothetical protein
MEHLDDNLIAIKAHINQKYLSLVNDAGTIIAASDAVSLREKFSIHYLDNTNRVAIKSESNGKFICATFFGCGELKANRDRVYKWETFDLIKL